MPTSIYIHKFEGKDFAKKLFCTLNLSTGKRFLEEKKYSHDFSVPSTPTSASPSVKIEFINKDILIIYGIYRATHGK